MTRSITITPSSVDCKDVKINNRSGSRKITITNNGSEEVEGTLTVSGDSWIKNPITGELVKTCNYYLDGNHFPKMNLMEVEPYGVSWDQFYFWDLNNPPYWSLSGEYFVFGLVRETGNQHQHMYFFKVNADMEYIACCYLDSDAFAYMSHIQDFVGSIATRPSLNYTVTSFPIKTGAAVGPLMCLTTIDNSDLSWVSAKSFACSSTWGGFSKIKTFATDEVMFMGFTEDATSRCVLNFGRIDLSTWTVNTYVEYDFDWGGITASQWYVPFNYYYYGNNYYITMKHCDGLQGDTMFVTELDSTAISTSLATYEVTKTGGMAGMQGFLLSCIDGWDDSNVYLGFIYKQAAFSFLQYIKNIKGTEEYYLYESTPSVLEFRIIKFFNNKLYTVFIHDYDSLLFIETDISGASWEITKVQILSNTGDGALFINAVVEQDENLYASGVLEHTTGNYEPFFFKVNPVYEEDRESVPSYLSFESQDLADYSWVSTSLFEVNATSTNNIYTGRTLTVTNIPTSNLNAGSATSTVYDVEANK